MVENFNSLRNSGLDFVYEMHLPSAEEQVPDTRIAGRGWITAETRIGFVIIAIEARE